MPVYKAERIIAASGQRREASGIVGGCRRQSACGPGGLWRRSRGLSADRA